MPRDYTRIPKVCEGCGKEFTIPIWRAKREVNPGRFCSMGCRTKAGGWHPPGYGRANLPEQQIVQEYESGDTGAVLASRYQVSATTISTILKRHGVAVRPNGTNLLNPATRMKVAVAPRPLRRPDIPIEEICKAYQAGESSDAIAARYGTSQGTIIARIRKAGITIRPPGYTDRVICADGHIADSQWEAQIDNWLFAHGIEHRIHPVAPWHTLGNGRGRIQRADFLCGDTYIEVWGIMGSLRYEQKRADKITQYQKHEAKLIEILPQHILRNDFSPLYGLLPDKESIQ